MKCLVGEGIPSGPKFTLAIHVVNKGTLKAQHRMIRTFGLNLGSKEQRVEAGMYDTVDLEEPMSNVALQSGMLCSIEEVVSTLDVPRFPSLMHRGALGYGMRSKLAIDLLGQVVDDIIPKTPLLRRFLLGELYPGI